MRSARKERLLTMRNGRLFFRTPEGVPRKRQEMQQVRSHGAFWQSVQEATKTTEVTVAAYKLGRRGIRK